MQFIPSYKSKRFIFSCGLLALLTITGVRTTRADSVVPSAKPMNLEALKLEAFSRCQAPYVAPVNVSVPMLDPPSDGNPNSTGMVFQEELAVRTSNLLDQNQFYFSPRPRAAVNTLPMDIYVDSSGSGNYTLKTWADANPDYSSSTIQPPIDRAAIPAAGQVLTELIVGHQSPQGDYPQLFDFRSSAYVRFAGFPPQVTGASLRLGAHHIFSQGGPTAASAPEDFPILRSMYVSTADSTTAHAYILLESKLFCGALSMDMSPTGNNAAITVDSFWYTREDYSYQNDPNTGLVAYSSMFWKSLQLHTASPTASAHDSDMMTLKYADGTQKKIAIAPPASGLAIHDLTSTTDHPAHYADFAPALQNTNYNLRASYAVKILDSNIKTGVGLYENGTDGEYGDNIVAVSTIRQDIKKATSVDQFVHFKYQTIAYYPSALVTPHPDGCDFIRQAIAALPASGGTIQIPAGTFNCDSKIVLKTSNVTLQGAGQDQTTLRLSDHFADAVLVIGDDQIVMDTNGNWVTATRISNVQVSDLTVDGNVENQDVQMECGNSPCDGNVASIRNNAITIRGASNVTLSRVTAHSAISGGLVTEKYCDHLHVANFTSYGNHFDGFAGYQTESSLFENMNLSRNSGAGISIDIQFNNNTFSGGILSGNADVGIFARNLNHVLFENMTISGSGNHGAFLADSGLPNTCANDNEFRSMTITGSKGYGIDISSACTGNKVTGTTTFQGNTSGCYSVNPNTTMAVDPTVTCQ